MRRAIPLAVLFVGFLMQTASADPCGMVPPISTNQQVSITRVGLQQTYVFYKDGVETFVIRPGFTGKVDEFGMLIPFPTPPEIRKVPDHVFGHIAAAVDPPEVVVDLRIRRFFAQRGGIALPRAPAPGGGGLRFKDQVRVIKQEAVGMYEVAVLEAGSAKALQRWMDAHGFKYPKGMDAVCEDYVDEGWCFVAVKTKVGQKKGVDPQPGQRKTNPKLPDGSTFDGHVQGMGFRFKVDELVVPMRLSAFNDGELRNIVYLLTDGPRKIRAIPEEYVVRQITGGQLTKNVTQPLPLRIIGGTEKQIPDYRRRTLAKERDPVPKNGAARDLFASDLLAATSGQLSLPHEEAEKVLLRIGERFGLRGADIDKLNNESLKKSRDAIVKKSLDHLKDMTLTVVDGDFPREVLGKQNLSFAAYRMPAKRNNGQSYDAKLNAPAPKKRGVLKVGTLTPTLPDQIAATRSTAGQASSGTPFSTRMWLLSALAVAVFGWLIVVRVK